MGVAYIEEQKASLDTTASNHKMFKETKDTYQNKTKEEAREKRTTIDC